RQDGLVLASDALPATAEDFYWWNARDQVRPQVTNANGAPSIFAAALKINEGDSIRLQGLEFVPVEFARPAIVNDLVPFNMLRVRSSLLAFPQFRLTAGAAVENHLILRLVEVNARRSAPEVLRLHHGLIAGVHLLIVFPFL